MDARANFSRRIDHQIGAVDACHFHAAAGRTIGSGHAPDGVADADGADTVDDRLLKREGLAD
jgi:hypothetical protein